MSFRQSSESLLNERKGRKEMTSRLLRLGVGFLDDALLGVFPGDLLLVGAASGIGKTQLCCNFAIANILSGKRVHYIALEAEEYEIERRLKYPVVAQAFFADKNRAKIDLSYDVWLSGVYDSLLDKYEEHAETLTKEAYKNLHVMYKFGNFGVENLIQTILSIADDSDLIIIDHAQYFDFEGEENRALKLIAKTCRDLALEEQKPIILVSHLRKKDKQNDELCAGIDEFFGSSDLAKIATRVVTISGGKATPSGNFETFFRVCKNRINGSSMRYSACLSFSPTKGTYEKEYLLGWAEQSRKSGFKQLDFDIQKPSWFGRSSSFSSNKSSVAKAEPKNHADSIGKRAVPYNPSND